MDLRWGVTIRWSAASLFIHQRFRIFLFLINLHCSLMTQLSYCLSWKRLAYRTTKTRSDDFEMNVRHEKWQPNRFSGACDGKLKPTRWYQLKSQNGWLPTKQVTKQKLDHNLVVSSYNKKTNNVTASAKRKKISLFLELLFSWAKSNIFFSCLTVEWFSRILHRVAREREKSTINKTIENYA
jgi:hypothetical protein